MPEKNKIRRKIVLINEIEITGQSLSFKCFNFKPENIQTTFDSLMAKGDMFDMETELPGFHDCDCESETIRGFYSIIVPFEVEHMVDGIITKTLFKRLESCEFIITQNSTVIFGKPNPIKMATAALSAITGDHIDLIKFEFQQLNQLQERMTRIKAAVLTNPKEKEVRRARLTGHMESYSEYNIVDQRNHGIETVAGLIDTPLGPLTVTVGKKGSVRLNVKRGLIMTVECIEWILALIMEEKLPEFKPVQSVF